MIEYKITTNNDMELLMQSRLEMLREVNRLPSAYMYDDSFVEMSRQYFESGNQTTVLAMDKEVVGCATLCYLDMMPTFSHPTGKRAHLMNVYTRKDYRRQGLAETMVNMLIAEAKQRGVTEISLDATEAGRPLYKKLGFVDSTECMVLNLNE